jgi:hypothetical protein
MEEIRLPRDLRPIERLLTSEPRPEPSAALRWRVLNQVQAELRRDRPTPRWRFAVAIAATLLVALSLSVAAIQRARSFLGPREVPPTIGNVAWQLRQVSPTLSKEESLRQAALRHVTVQGGILPSFGDIRTENDNHNP